MKKSLSKIVALGCAAMMVVTSLGNGNFIKTEAANIHSYSLTDSQVKGIADRFEEISKKLITEHDQILTDLEKLKILYNSDTYIREWTRYKEKILSNVKKYLNDFKTSEDKHSYFTTASLNNLSKSIKTDLDNIELCIGKCTKGKEDVVANIGSYEVYEAKQAKAEYDSVLLNLSKSQESVQYYLDRLASLTYSLEIWEKATPTPIIVPTVYPTKKPTETPAAMPTQQPTAVPTVMPTQQPTVVPTAMPTQQPTIVPTAMPTQQPTIVPTAMPTQSPSTVTVMFTGNGGMFASGTTLTINYPKGSTQIITPDSFPTYDGYVFDGYVSVNGIIGYSPSGNCYIYNVPDSNDILIAQWKVKPIPTVTPIMSPVVPTLPTDTVPTTFPIEPTVMPTSVSTTEPTAEPTVMPTAVSTTDPTAEPTSIPTVLPTETAMPTPTIEATSIPTALPTAPVSSKTPEKTVTPVVLKTKAVTIGKGEKLTFPLLNKKGNKITYHMSNKKIATVTANGKITGKQIGSTKVYAVSNGKKYIMTVKVKKKPTTIKITRVSNIKMSKGDKLILQAVLDKGAASYHLKWNSSNKKVLEVDSKGVASIKGRGKTLVTVRTYNGLTGKLRITIK